MSCNLQRSVCEKAWNNKNGGEDIPDFDKLKWHDDETLGSPSTTANDDRKLPCHFGLASQVPECFSPEIICCAESQDHYIIRLRHTMKETHPEDRKSCVVIVICLTS